MGISCQLSPIFVIKVCAYYAGTPLLVCFYSHSSILKRSSLFKQSIGEEGKKLYNIACRVNKKKLVRQNARRRVNNDDANFNSLIIVIDSFV
jgi:hypothetical protein